MGYIICPRCRVRYFQKYNYKLLRQSQDEIANELGVKVDVNDTICVACLDVLRDDVINNCIDAVTIEAQKYNFDSFKINVLQPVQLIVCNKVAVHELSQQSDDHDLENLQNCLEVKDAFKSILEPLLEIKLNSKCGTNASLEINISLRHELTETHMLSAIESLVPESFNHAKHQLNMQSRKRQRDDLTYFTIASVTTAVSRLDYEQIVALLKSEYLQQSAQLGSISTMHQPLLVGGRYMKYSRVLSQTPWLIDGVRKSEMSVEEYLTGPILKQYAGDGCMFSSSGREDCDVRMLGDGRPFIVEVINPKKYSREVEIINSLEKEINSSTKNIQVQSLQVLTKFDVKTLKEGEESKTKTYCAYCLVKVDEGKMHDVKEKLKNISGTKNLKINQKTPMRVLHRRCLSIRPRLIEELDIEIIEKEKLNEHENILYFKLNLTSQAGTYIKEFVHGDFGRTIPSLCSILESEVDIINLDVKSINIDWP